VCEFLVDVMVLPCVLYLLAGLPGFVQAHDIAINGLNSTYYNPILPGFHPDPSCIFVSDWDKTFFCASSSFNAFPGIPIHASKDLQNWKLIGNVFPVKHGLTVSLTTITGHVLNRKEQLPRLQETNRSTRSVSPRIKIWETSRDHTN
jgi:Glycosyl hydrolases family 43